MEAKSQTHDPYDVTAPRYGPALVRMAWSVAPGAVTLVAVLVADLAWVWRAVAVASVVGAAMLTVNVWFASRWLWCQWRKARLYPAVLNTKEALEGRLAAWEGTLVVAAGAPPVRVRGLYEVQSRLRMVLAGDTARALKPGDVLLVVDTLEQRLVGKARVLAGNAGRREAEVDQPLDAVFWGFVRPQIRRYRRRLPREVAVFREADVLVRHEAFVRLMQEVEQ